MIAWFSNEKKNIYLSFVGKDLLRIIHIDLKTKHVIRLPQIQTLSDFAEPKRLPGGSPQFHLRSVSPHWERGT